MLGAGRQAGCARTFGRVLTPPLTSTRMVDSNHASVPGARGAGVFVCALSFVHEKYSATPEAIAWIR